MAKETKSSDSIVTAGLEALTSRGDRRPKFVVSYTLPSGAVKLLPLGIALDAVNRAKRATTQENGMGVQIWTFDKTGDPYVRYVRPEPKVGSKGGKPKVTTAPVNESGLTLEQRRLRKNAIEDFVNMTRLFRKNEEFAQRNLRQEWMTEFLRTYLEIGGTLDELVEYLSTPAAQ